MELIFWRETQAINKWTNKYTKDLQIINDSRKYPRSYEKEQRWVWEQAYFVYGGQGGIWGEDISTETWQMTRDR